MQKIDLGFIILSPNGEYGLVNTTYYSIKKWHSTNINCIVSDVVKEKQAKDINKICPITIGGSTITSLINEGFKNATNEWNMIIMEGSVYKKHTYRKILTFLTNDKEIFFPVDAEYDRRGYPTMIYDTFDVCSLNGITMHKKTFKSVGKLSDNPLHISRLMWALTAIDKKFKFKGIAGFGF